MSTAAHYLFLTTSSRAPGELGNTEWLARHAAQALPAEAQQTWWSLAHHPLPPFVDQRHTVGHYPAPEGVMAELLDATLAASHLVLISPVYWFSLPAALKTYLDHWSAWLRVPGLDFKARMAGKPLLLVSTSGDRAKAQPMVDSVQLCAQFMGMEWGGVLWGKGGAPGAVQADAQALEQAAAFLRTPVQA